MTKAIYPWLVSIYPILHLYSRNLGAVRDEEVPVALGVSLALTTVIFFTLRSLTRDSHRPALTTAILLLLFFSYGHLATLAADRGLKLVEHLLLPAMLLCSGALILGVWLLLRGKDLNPLTRILNIVALTMLAFPSTIIASHWGRALVSNAEEIVAIATDPLGTRKVSNRGDRPDIYYIITDGYSSNAHLLREFSYDNSTFTDALESLGFYVAYNSKSNYGATLHSLSSSLNLRYVPENTTGSGIDDLIYLRRLIADNEVARFLIARGYTYIFMLSGYLLPSRIADVNVDFTPLGVMEFGFHTVATDLERFNTDAIVNGSFYKEPFYRFVSDSTLLKLFGSKLTPILQNKNRPYHWSDTDRFFAALERLRAVAEIPEATFTFVHLLEPHGPVQLRRDGKKLEQPTWNPRPAQFFEELELINEHLLVTLRAIIEKSAVPPIIILQGDHGTTLGRVWTDDHRLTNFEIMNAFLLPGERPAELKRDISPINTFRMLLNKYFYAHYKSLEVKFFDIPKGYDAPFQQVDVTDQPDRGAESTNFYLDDGVLVNAKGVALRRDQKRLVGAIDTLDNRTPGLFNISGWIGDRKTWKPARAFLVVISRSEQHLLHPSGHRADLMSVSEGLEFAGFQTAIRFKGERFKLEDVQMFAIFDEETYAEMRNEEGLQME